MRKSIRKKISGLLGILISVAVLWYLSEKVDFAESWARIAFIPWPYFVWLPAVYLLAFLWRGKRWQLMLAGGRQVAFIKILNSVVIGFAGNNVLPARGGELVRMEYFSKHTGESRVTALSSVLAERILDGVCLLLFLAVGGLLAPDDLLAVDWFRQLFSLVLLVFGGAVAVLVVIAFKGRWLVGFFGKKEKAIWQKVGSVVEKIAVALQFFRSGQRSFWVMLLGVMVWLTEGLMFGLALQAAGMAEGALLAGYVTLAVVNFGLLVPSSPAYLGVFQGMSILALSLFGLEEETALSIGILVHLCQFLPITLWGLGIFLAESLKTIQKSTVAP